ncbi:hypothetical protein BGZ70_007097 [Mortierella alpina]|uniref:F-box domain-containing protein n=1 Tax=Mortierella alpina TaxID=64518 RepID=A0A9P6JA97_MORAP|nr:hypothetical protein BGZ70_007097 [Mortierella alpina]
MSQHAAIKLFEIPELSILVLGQLERPDLAACAQVHRTWHRTIIPFLYRTFLIGDRYRPFSAHLNKANWDRFRKHSSHIQVLEVSSRAQRDIGLFDFNCTNLTDLYLNVQLAAVPQKNAQWFKGLLKLISNNPSISTLRLLMSDDPVVNDIDHHLVVLGLLRYMPELKKLVIIGPSMGETSVDEIMRCAYRLEELDVNLNRINVEHAPRPCKPPIGFDLASHLSNLFLKDHNTDVAIPDGLYILDSQGRRCRQGSSLKKFCLSLDNIRDAFVHLADPSPLVRLCYSAEHIQLCISDVMEGSSQRNCILTLHEQVSHPAWRLKHLDIGRVGSEDVSVLIKILDTSSSPLTSLRLWEVSFTDELLSVLVQKHGKTLRRVSVGKCQGFFSRAKVEALVSGCPNLQSLDLFNSDYESVDGARLQDASVCQWNIADGRIFKVFVSDEAFYAYHADGYYSPEEYAALMDEPIPDDPWLHLDLMWRPDFQSHLRFVAN